MATTLTEQPTRTKQLSLISATADYDPAKEVKVSETTNPMPEATLGDLGVGAHVSGPQEFPLTMLLLPFENGALAGIDSVTVRMFRVDAHRRTFRPVWNSGINTTHGFAWAKIRRTGIYVPIGLPRDRLLAEVVRELARQRKYSDAESAGEAASLTARALEPFLRAPLETLEQIRELMALLEFQTGIESHVGQDMVRGSAFTLKAFPLPRNATQEEFRRRVERLDPPVEGLPEEALIFAPEKVQESGPPWPVPPDRRTAWTALSSSTGAQIADLQEITRLHFPPFPLCWLFSQDWWMYHHDENHSGDASGCSGIRSTSAHSLVLQSTVPVDNTIISIPAIVDGHIYIGTISSGGGGTLYKIDVITGGIDYTFHAPFSGGGVWGSGIGGTPAVVGNKVYISTLDGKIYCLDASTLTQEWVTDLRNPDLAHNQPVNNTSPPVACWTSPLVVNGKVYVGVGLGEDAPGPHGAAFGFVYCLDAANGHVRWLLCTNKFADVTNNSPNDIPHSLLSGPPPAGFTRHAGDPPSRGASVWSSCVYDAHLNRIFVGTGNTNPDQPLPNDRYSSGVLSIDADSGQFKGFFQPDPSDSYRPDDNDVDIPSSPMLFWRQGHRVLAIGSKNGSLFLLDPATMARLGSRQMLPYINDDPATPVPTIDTESISGPGENHSGMYGSAAVHYGYHYLFAGLGGWSPGGIDSPTTPFMRAMHWSDSLDDAWTTVIGGDGVARYNVPAPPMYSSANETGLSSPAVVNDVVFVSTNRPALYALDVATGACLWSAPGLPAPPPGSPANNVTVMGPAVYGDYVVIGCGTSMYIYTLQRALHLPPWWVRQLVASQWPPPPPDPTIVQEEIEIVQGLERREER